MGSKSKSSTSTTSNFYDQRQVNDAGGGVIGGGTIDNSISVVDRSSATYNTTDAGSIKAAQDIAVKAIAAAQKSSDSAVAGAVAVTQSAIDSSEYTTGRAFDLALKSAVQSSESSGAALGLARNAIDAAAGAYQSAADTGTGNKTLIYAGLAAVALVGVAVLFRK